MSSPLNPSEQLHMAVEMECRGQGLYLRAQRLTDDAKLHALLGDLAKEEAIHYELFSAMLEEMDEPVTSEERIQLAQAMAGDAFYPGGLMQLSAEGGLASREAMLQAAIRAEEDSIAYYTNLLAKLAGKAAETVRRILQEEEGHLRTLRAWLQAPHGEDGM